MSSRKTPDGSKYLKYVLFLLIILTLQNTNYLVNAQTVVLDNSENAFSGYIFWPDFLQDCGKDSYMDTGGELQDIQADIIFNFDTGKITGTISAKQVDEKFPDVYKEDSSVQGTINGVMEKKNDYGSAGYWQWVFSGEVDFTIHYHMEHKCSDDTGGYWETEDQTLTKKGVLTGGTWGELWSLDLRWEDQETRDGRTRYVQLSPDNSLSQIVLPKPIDLKVSITMSSEANLNSDKTPFKLDVSGRDVNMIDHFEWYFAYWEPDLERYWGLQNEQSFETKVQESLEVTDAMRNEWKRIANEFGVEGEDGTEINLQINLRTIDPDGIDLVENVAFNYTYTDTSGASSGSGSTSETTSDPDTAIPPPVTDSSSLFGGMTGALVTMGVVTIGGYGLFRLLKKPGSQSVLKNGKSIEKKDKMEDSVKITSGSEINAEISDDFSEDSLSIKPGKLDGTIDSSDFSIGGSESRLNIDSGSQINVDLEVLQGEDIIDLEDTINVIEGNGGSKEETLDSLNLQPGSELDTEINNVQLEPSLNIAPSNFDGAVEKGIIPSEDNEITLNQGSQEKVDLDKYPLEDSGSVKDISLRLERDAKTETKDISKSELNGNFRLIVDAQIEDSGNFAVSSDSQIDSKKDTKSGAQTQNEETQDSDSSKTDDPDAES